MGLLAVALLTNPLANGSPAAPALLASPALVDDAICAPSFSSTNLPCCLDAQGEPDMCSASVTVTPSSIPTCQPCSFTYTVEISCATCGSIEMSGQSGISCAHREGHTFSCPDGEGNGLHLQFRCGYCELDLEQQ